MRNIYFCFPGGKHKALTLSYDDGNIADRRLVEIFNRYGIKATFNLNGGLNDKQDKVPVGEYAGLYGGHEIACHTITHPTLERCPADQVVLQVLEDRKILEKYTGYAVRGLAYPNGSYNSEIKSMLPSTGVRYARVVANSGSFSMPEDTMEWRPTCHHDHDLDELAGQFLELKKVQYLYLMYVWGHSYEFNNNDNWDII